MRFSPTALILLVITKETNADLSSACLKIAWNPFEFSGEGNTCTFEKLLESFELQYYNSDVVDSSGCGHDAKTELIHLLDANDEAGGKAKVKSLCHDAFQRDKKMPFYMAANKGNNNLFENIYYDGGTYWNEETETMYPLDIDGQPSNVLRDSRNIEGDAGQIRRFYDNEAQYVQLSWPGSMSNFDLDTCEIHAAMCCWPRDRQANDNNGNCATPYDEGCIDADPADNTDLCFVDLDLGNGSTKFDSKGSIVHPGDDNNESDDAEGPIHCHGFAWSSVDEDDFTARYKGNNLFYVSMYDHMHQRGYVENLQGAPMCACLEQMPTVDQSDCTQIDVEESFRCTFNHQSNKFSCSLTDVYIDFNSCQGINNQNNELWEYFGRLYMEGKVTKKEYIDLNKIIVEQNNCHVATKQHMSEKGLVTGYKSDDWVQVAGKSSFDMPSYGQSLFRKVLDEADEKIVLRVCADCAPYHRKIYYKRLTAYDETDVLHWLKNNRGQQTGHVFGTDFELYSSYEDAVAGTNKWDCVYNHGQYFPGDCAPDGSKSNQVSRFESPDGRLDVAFYARKSAFTDGITIQPTTSVGNAEQSYQGALRMDGDGFMYMSGFGKELYYLDDHFQFYGEEVSGDVDLIVKVEDFDPYDQWSKTGLMIRDTTSLSSAYVGCFLSGNHGVYVSTRPTDGDETSSGGFQWNSNTATTWLMLSKRLDTFTCYRKPDQASEWEMVHTVQTISIDDSSLHVGLILTSKNDNGLAEAKLSSYDMQLYFHPSAAPSTSAAPSNFVEDLIQMNIETVPTESKALEQGPHLTINGIGTQIWGNYESMTYYNHGGWVGDFTTQLYVKSIEPYTPNTVFNWHTKVALMIRDNVDPKAKYVAMVYSPTYKETYIQRRLDTAGWAGTQGDKQRDVEGGVWFRIVKRGNVFGMFRSLDAVEWEHVDDVQLVLESHEDVHVGVGVCSGFADQMVVANFQHFSIVDDNVA